MTWGLPDSCGGEKKEKNRLILDWRVVFVLHSDCAGDVMFLTIHLDSVGLSVSQSV